MARTEAKSADELTAAIRSLVNKAMEAEVRDRVATRGRDLAAALTNAGETAFERANEAWRESEPARLEAARNAEQAGQRAWSWSLRTWDRRLRPALREQLKRRGTAIAAAGMTVPTSAELMRNARVRLGIERREARRWRYFTVGLLLGALVGAIAALLTAPRSGREVRDGLGARARDAATSAREAAGTAGEWAPLFQRSTQPPSEEAAPEVTATDGDSGEASEATPEETEAH